MNRHGDHVASCLCCKQLAWDSGFPGSEITPADGGFYKCKVMRFEYAFPGNGESLHRELKRAQECTDFEERAP